MKAPQIIYIVLSAVALLLGAHNHGKARPDENFWRSLIACALTSGLLYWGGFFN